MSEWGYANTVHMRVLQSMLARTRRQQLSRHRRTHIMRIQRSARNGISPARIPVSISGWRLRREENVLVGRQANRLLEKPCQRRVFGYRRRE